MPVNSSFQPLRPQFRQTLITTPCWPCSWLPRMMPFWQLTLSLTLTLMLTWISSSATLRSAPISRCRDILPWSRRMCLYQRPHLPVITSLLLQVRLSVPDLSWDMCTSYSLSCRHMDALYRPCLNKYLWPRLFFSYYAPKRWNLLPSDICRIQSSHVCKTLTKSHLCKQYHNKWFQIQVCFLPPPPPPTYLPSLLVMFLLCACMCVLCVCACGCSVQGIQILWQYNFVVVVEVLMYTFLLIL